MRLLKKQKQTNCFIINSILLALQRKIMAKQLTKHFSKFFSWILIVPLIGSIPYLLRISNYYFHENLPVEFMQRGGELIGFSIALVIATFIEIGINEDEETKRLKHNLAAITIIILVSVILIKTLSIQCEINPKINQLRIFYASIITCTTAVILNLFVFFKIKKHD